MRVGNAIVGKMTEISRAGKQDAVLAAKKEAEQLYLRHRGVFARANAVLEQHGMQRVSCKGITFSGQAFSLNNALSNDDWVLEFDALVDKVRDFLDKSTEAADQLINNLERIQDEKADPALEIAPATS
jgi:hypothetical protein